MAYTGSKAMSAQQTTISVGGVGFLPATSTPIGEVTKLGLSGRKWDTDDVSNLQSTAKEFINGLANPGEWSLEGNRVAADAGLVALEQRYADGALTTFTIQMPKANGQATSGDKYTFTALVVELDYNFDTAKAIKFSCKLQVSGAMTFTAGA